MKGVSILGSTGSIGINTLDIIRRHPERFKVVSLAAGNNVRLLKKQIDEFAPRCVSVLTEKAALELKRSIQGRVEIGVGIEGAASAAAFPGADIVVSAISGAAGLVPTMAAIKAGRDIALANKETLVMAGAIVMREVKKRRIRLMPIDSEHSAVFQALEGHRRQDVRRIILTASGGPFLNTPLKRLKDVTPEEALNHPRWRMGRKISIDSATLVNKGLEVIEARWLFDMAAERISVAIHPQSVVHSMVEYIDGSIVAQMGAPDMKGPISYALSYPERIVSGAPALDLKGLSLEFAEPDLKRFPCLGLACDALKDGGVMPAVLNAADEAAVDAFLKGRIGFTGIHRVIAKTLDAFVPSKGDAIEDIIEADCEARDMAKGFINAMQGRG
ncbi:MAG: 1-deoxy-D-xylulose-5-phosphate reductoisomerase [Deltaproteobacteria bacterium]|nr:1-deoxy-D-xylulose-5-phosphate reductoisomerase [Deltaproteobacteria bacterium]